MVNPIFAITTNEFEIVTDLLRDFPTIPGDLLLEIKTYLD